jgi:ABC-type lipoprotein export system ATPase subunit
MPLKGRRVRLTRLQAKNFRSFFELDLELDDFTLLVGPNDAGKSTLLDAVRCLLSDTDRLGRRWQRSLVQPEARRLRLDFEDELNPYSPWGDEHVYVVGTFSDLNAEESSSWGEGAVDGRLRVGVFFWPQGANPDATRQGPYVLRPAGLEAFHLMRPGMNRGRPVVAVQGAPDLGDGTEWLDAMIGTRFVGPNEDETRIVTTVRLRLPVVAGVNGPETGAPSIQSLLEPIVDAGVDRLVGQLQTDVRDLIVRSLSGLLRSIDDGLAASVPKYLDNSTGASVQPPWGYDDDIVRLALASRLENMKILVQRRLGFGDVRDWDQDDPDREEPGQPVWRDSEPLDSLGAGAQRSVALAVLELYLNPDLWPPEQSVVLLIEEPEVGLHPAAQRQVASALRQLSGRFGVTALIVTHSPVLMDGADLENVRLIRPPEEVVRVLRPDGLVEVAELLGAKPSDVMLGSTFVVVEGPSDVPIFKSWAARLGVRFDRLGIKLFDSKGWTKADVVTELLRLTYLSARFHVVLDGGEEIVPEVRELKAKYEGRVEVNQLRYREIEAYFAESAIRTWAVSAGAGDPDLTRLEESRISGGVARLLNAVTHAAFRRNYDKVDDGTAIAGLMSEATISAEIKGIIYGIARLAEAPTQ